MQSVRQVLTKLLNVGIPTSGVGVTLHFIFSQQWTAAIVSSGVTFVLALATIGRKFVKKVLARLEERLLQRAEPLADQILSEIDRLIPTLTSGFQNQYYQSLIYAYRTFRTQGLSVSPLTPDLEKVFVPLRVKPESLGQISAAMIQQKQTAAKIASDRLSIWQFLATTAAPRIAIVAPPGSGKSTLLEHLTLTYARNTQRQQNRKAPSLIPILLYLRDWRETIATNTALSLPQLIEQQIKRLPSDQPIAVPPDWFKRNLERGKCLVMLDGLDEVADESQRHQVSQWVNEQMRIYPSSTFVLTSRPYGYDSVKTNLNQITLVLSVQQLNLGEIQQFIHNWYRQNELMRQARQEDPGVRETARQKAEDLVDRIKRTPALAAMALNPLLLTMIATVHCYRGALPGRRVELYAEICDVLLGRRQAAKGTPDKLTAVQKQTVLQVLALKGMQRNTREFKRVTACLLIRQRLETVAGSGADPEQFIKSIENVSGLLIEREQGLYEFAHKSFQEYLAAVQVKEISQEMLLARHIDDPWWEETIRLYTAQSDASYLIRAAIDRNTVGALTIAYDCLAEGLSVEPKIRQALEAALENGLESINSDIFKLAAEVKLSRRLKNLLRIDEKTEIDMSYITCAEYQLFIDEKRLSGENRQPDHWTSDRFTPGDANQPILGVRASDAIEFCDWLTGRSGRLGDTFLEGKSSVFVGEVRFRLPVLLEVREQPISIGQVGCWAKTENNLENNLENDMTIAGIEPNQLQTWRQQLSKLLNADPACAITLTLGILLNFNLDRAIDLDHARAIDFDRTHVRTRASDLDLDRTIALNRVRDLIRDLAHVRFDSASANDRLLEAARIYLRSAFVTWDSLADAYMRATRDRRLLKSKNLTRQECEERSLKCATRAAETAKLFVFFALLTERQAGRMPAWESIRIVRERVTR